MSEHNDPERVWDEYDWERFLQQQDRKTERYMELLEQYNDDPERDRIIAREMGWNHVIDADSSEWEDNDGLDEDADAQDDFSVDAEIEAEGFELHPLYQASFALTVWMDQLFDELGDLENSPSAVKLIANSHVASSKLAAAFSDDDIDEIGMTIAYLKRALKAMSVSIDASLQFGQEAKLNPQQRRQLRIRLFQVRDGIVEAMGQYRAEWRRRFGQSR